jgi:hypothetical protein
MENKVILIVEESIAQRELKAEIQKVIHQVSLTYRLTGVDVLGVLTALQIKLMVGEIEEGDGT